MSDILYIAGCVTGLWTIVALALSSIPRLKFPDKYFNASGLATIAIFVLAVAVSYL